MAEVEVAQIEESKGKEVISSQENDDERESVDDQFYSLPKQDQGIIKQMEYYFSEQNLRRDKFLTGKIAENEDGWVELSVMLTFNRLKALTTDSNVIVEALEKSPNGVIQISDDKLKVRRHPDNPLPEFDEARRKEIQSRTAYAKGFPLDSVLSEILDYFHANFKNIEQVVMRKYLERESKKYLFKGSVFVTFTKPEYAEDFVQAPDLKYKEKVLLRYMQAKYFVVKREEDQKRREKYSKRGKNGNGQKGNEEPEMTAFPKGAVLSFTGIVGEVSREEIKDAFNQAVEAVEVAYINFSRGATEGHLRFAKENDAKKIIEKFSDGKFKLNDTMEIDLKLLEGEEEENYLKKATEDMKNHRLRHSNNKGRRGGRQQFGNRKRKNDDNDGGAKKARVGNDDD